MHFLVGLFLQLISLTSVVASNNPVHRYAQLRLWDSIDCHGRSLGEEGIYGSQVDLCVPMPDDNTIHSMKVEFIDLACSGTVPPSSIKKSPLIFSSLRL